VALGWKGGRGEIHVVRSPATPAISSTAAATHAEQLLPHFGGEDTEEQCVHKPLARVPNTLQWN